MSLAIVFLGLVRMEGSRREGGSSKGGIRRGCLSELVDKRKEAMWQEYVESLRLLEGERDRGGSGNSREGITHTAGEARPWRGVGPTGGV